MIPTIVLLFSLWLIFWVLIPAIDTTLRIIGYAAFMKWALSGQCSSNLALARTIFQDIKTDKSYQCDEVTILGKRWKPYFQYRKLY